MKIMNHMDLVYKTIYEQHGFHFNERQIRSSFGVCPQTIAVLISFILSLHLDCLAIEPKHILWTLFFFKEYSTVDMATNWKCESKTYRLYLWRVVMVLREYLNTVILLIMFSYN